MILHLLDKLHDYTLNLLVLIVIPFILIYILSRKIIIQYKNIAIKLNDDKITKSST